MIFKSKLMIIGIANTLDFPLRFVSSISSCLGSQSLIFRPYSSAQIAEIISQRVNQAKIFDKKALEFLYKKVVRVTSDIRKVLSICRESIQNYAKMIQPPKKLGKRAKKKKQKKDENRIGIEVVEQAFQTAFESPLVHFVEGSTVETKLLLIVLYREVAYHSIRERDGTIFTHKLYQRLQLARHFSSENGYGIDAFRFTDMKMVLDLLAEAGIVELKTHKNKPHERVVLMVSVEDLAYSLRNETEFIKINSPIESIGLF